MRANLRIVLTAVGAGLLIALSVPPVGLWPLGIVGLLVLVRLLADRPVRQRALIGFAGGMGLYAVTIFWFAEFNAIGAVVSMMIEAAFLALAAALTPPVRFRRAGWVAGLVVSDWLRTRIPFGGVPLGGVPLGQAAGPLAPAARIGGPLLVTAVTALLAVAIDALVGRARAGSRIDVAGSARLAGVVGVSLALALGLPTLGRVTSSGRVVGATRVAVVQGGGRRGLRAVHNSAQAVFDAHVAASQAIHDPVDLILWPEDVIALGGPIDATPVATKVGSIAASHHAALLAGATEDIGKDKFRNAEVVWDSTGRITGRYDKVHRVPFGEYIPGRALIRHIVNLDVIPRDAIAGRGTGEVMTSAGPVGIVISFEVFFSERSRSAIKHGGQILMVPTNTASYTTTQVPSAEIAADRLRAWETGRDVVMAAPTGWSAVLDDRGRLLQRSHLGAAQVLQATVQRRTGQTPYVRWGDLPWALLAAVILVSVRLRALDRLVNSGKP